MKNGWKKMPISHDFEKTTRIQTKRFVLLARKALSVGGVLNFSEELLLSAASVRQRYHTVLDEKRRENEATRRSERKRSLLEEISTLK